MPLSKKLLAEFIGTFWLVFGGMWECGFCRSRFIK
jgi:glycerol uptake facilitator-like aquaporin